MDDMTKIKGIGKATARRLSAAGFETYASLAGATDAASLAKLQDAGFATVDIDAWTIAAAQLIATETNSEGGKDGQSDPASAPAPADAGASPSGEAEGPAAPDAPADGEVPQGTISRERRRFPVESAVLCDGKDARPERGDRIDITFAQHRELRLAGVVSVEWEEGDAVDA